MIKKIISCLLITVVCLTCLISCKDDGTPDGMYSATIEGEPFILYVPEGWIDNRDSGISSAYYSLNDALTVSARYYIPEGDVNEQEFLARYIDAFAAEYAQNDSSFKLVGKQTSSLGTNDAVRLEYTIGRVISANGGESVESVSVIQYFTVYESKVVVLSMYCRTSAYSSNEDYAEHLEKIRREFVLTPSQSKNDSVIDKNTPAGMKRISFDGCEYLFYAPESWVCNMSDKLTEAYYPAENAKPNITVTSYSPDTVVTAAEYFAMCEEQYKKDIQGYELISSTEGETLVVAERNAISYVYKAESSGIEYRIMQTVLVYNEIVYSVTYTAPVESFDAHLDDVNSMLAQFKFR